MADVFHLNRACGRDREQYLVLRSNASIPSVRESHLLTAALHAMDFDLGPVVPPQKERLANYLCKPLYNNYLTKLGISRPDSANRDCDYQRRTLLLNA